jgi:glyoxylase-like metal-dependent hydrolase (beta-lactamase superfamily II)
MRHFFTLLTLAAFSAMPAAAGEGDGLFRVTRLTDRIVVFTDVTPWESNHVVIRTEKGLVLFDPGHSPLMGRLIREAVARELGRDRFASVVDTHEHWGHTWGGAAFPEAMVIAHELAAPAMTADAANREARARRIGELAGEARTRLASLDPASEGGRAAKVQAEHFDRIARGLAEPGMVVRLPDLTFSERMELDLGDVTLRMLYLGRGHSPSDIAVVVPEEGAVMLGCFFFEQDGLPTFGAMPKLDPDRWLEVLSAVLGDQPSVEHVILGQHSIWPRARLAAMRDAIAAMWSSVKASDASGVNLEEAIKRLPAGATPAFVRESGIDGKKVANYTRTGATALWRQLKRSAADEIQRTLDASGVAAATARFEEVRADTATFVDEAEVNLLGYRYLQAGATDAAIAVFEMNVAAFPGSWNVYDSLGEAYAAKGDRARAVELYRRSLELNPANTNATAALERLTADPPK